MKNHFSPHISDEDLDLYLVGKATKNLTTSIEEHYFGPPAPGKRRQWEMVVLAATVASLMPLVYSRLAQKPPVETIATAMVTPALPFASAIAATIDLYAPVVEPITIATVRRPPPEEPKITRLFQLPPQQPHTHVHIAMVEPPAVAIHSRAIPELPFEPEIPQVAAPKPHRLRRILSGAALPFKIIFSLDRYNHGA